MGSSWGSSWGTSWGDSWGVIAVPATTLFLRPDADSVTGTWTNESGGLPLYPSIDEPSPHDADYIQSGNLTLSTPDICVVRMSDPSPAALPCTVRYRYKKAVTGTETVDLLVRLLQGSREIGSWAHVGISTTAVTEEQIVSSGITDFNDLYLEFTGRSGSIGTGLSGQAMGLLMAITQA